MKKILFILIALILSLSILTAIFVMVLSRNTSDKPAEIATLYKQVVSYYTQGRPQQAYAVWKEMKNKYPHAPETKKLLATYPDLALMDNQNLIEQRQPIDDALEDFHKELKHHEFKYLYNGINLDEQNNQRILKIFVNDRWQDTSAAGKRSFVELCHSDWMRTLQNRQLSSEQNASRIEIVHEWTKEIVASWDKAQGIQIKK